MTHGFDAHDVLKAFRNRAARQEPDTQALIDAMGRHLREFLTNVGLDPSDDDVLASVLATAYIIVDFERNPDSHVAKAFGSPAKAILMAIPGIWGEEVGDLPDPNNVTGEPFTCAGPAPPQTAHTSNPRDPATWCPECTPEPDDG